MIWCSLLIIGAFGLGMFAGGILSERRTGKRLEESEADRKWLQERIATQAMTAVKMFAKLAKAEIEIEEAEKHGYQRGVRDCSQ